MFKKISDKNIIEGIRRQDDVTLNWLYDNYFQSVKKHVLKNSGDAEDVSDVFQDSIIILYNQIKENTLNLTTDLKGYFFSIARNVWYNQLRRKKQTTELDENYPDDTSADDLHDPFFERIVSRSFSKLKPEFQTVLQLFADGHDYKEIASIMNLKNENYARRKKYLCKEALMELIKKDPEYQEYLRFQK